MGFRSTLSQALKGAALSPRDALTRPTSQEIENARTKGQLIGWVQGAGAMLVLGVVLRFIGWIPLLAVGAVVVILAFKVLFGGKKG